MIPVHSLLLNDGARTRSTGIWSDIPSLLSRGLFGLHWDVKKLTFVAIAFVALLLMFFVARSATPVVDLPSGVASLGHATPITVHVHDPRGIRRCKYSLSRIEVGTRSTTWLSRRNRPNLCGISQLG